MENLLQDVRYAVRLLLKRPGFTAAVVMTLALGIGANTAIFSVVNGVLIHPLPFKDSHRLVAIQEFNQRVFSDPVGTSLPNFRDWEERNQDFEQIAAYGGQSFTLTSENEPLRVSAQSVSPSFFEMLEVQPVLGRTFLPEEGKADRRKVVVLSYGLWQRRFGGDPGILDRALTLDGSPYQVAGVMPAGFRFLRDADLWTPLDVPAVLQQMRGARFLQVVARLRVGISLEQARADMAFLAQQLESQYSQSNSGWGISVRSLQDRVVGDVKQSLLLLLAAASFVLLIACANVANLLLARGASRQKEVSVRIALGASRARLTRQLLTESTILALLGGAAALLLSLWAIEVLRGLSPSNLPRLDEVGIDKTVLAFTLVVSLFTGLLFGLAPIRQAFKVDLQTSLKESGSATSGSRSRFGSALVIGEIALSLILLVGAGLLTRSLLKLLSVDPGFKADNVLTMELSLPQYRYSKEEQQRSFFKQLLERTAVLPRVRSAALTTLLPLTGNESKNTFSIEGRESSDKDSANMRVISANYFQTMGIRLVAGRDFESRDTAGAPDVVIINEAMARRYWSDENPIGKKILFGDDGSTIVGVVGDIKHTGLSVDAEPELYLPYLQTPSQNMVLVTRADSNAMAMVGLLRDAVHFIDKDQPVENFRTMEQIVSTSVAQPRFLAVLLVAFSSLALVLATVGVYGVMAFSVAQRTRELGIRLALGAEAGDIIKLVLARAAFLALFGIAAGLLGAFALTRVVSGFLFGVSATDPLTFTAVSLILAGVALGASFVPARRAMRVDPMIALRCE